tara:strand:+ start:74499 stop:74750 length:252 start_codon:yes stop_codon:yes gene_type:complete
VEFGPAIDDKTTGTDRMIGLSIAGGASQGCHTLAKALVPVFAGLVAAFVRLFHNRVELSVKDVAKPSQIAGQREGFHAPRKTA